MTREANVPVEVSPFSWDCLVCSLSVENVPVTNGDVECPRCQSLMRIVTAPRAVMRMDVQLIRRHGAR